MVHTRNTAKNAKDNTEGRAVKMLMRIRHLDSTKIVYKQTADLLSNLEDFTQYLELASFPASKYMDGSPTCSLSMETVAGIMGFGVLRERARLALRLVKKDLAVAQFFVDNPDAQACHPVAPRNLFGGSRDQEETSSETSEESDSEETESED